MSSLGTFLRNSNSTDAKLPNKKGAVDEEPSCESDPIAFVVDYQIFMSNLPNMLQPQIDTKV